jgi:hypothetical protein
MRKLLSISLLIFVSISSCNSTKSLKGQIAVQNDFLKVNVAKTYQLGENILFELTNISTEKLIVYSPTKPILQKMEENGWRNIRILNCPCDAPCQAPPEKMNLAKGKTIKIKWNQKESYCGKKTDAGIRETISKSPGKGKISSGNKFCGK